MTRRTAGKLGLAALAAPAFSTTVIGQTAPIKIGSSMAMTGGLGPNGKSSLLAIKLWEEDVNARGGLLGRKVQVIFRDDQSNPSTIPGIYTQLLDVEKVDLIMGGYATVPLAPTLPIAMQRKKLLIGLLGLGVNSEFHYPNYFVIIPSGPDPKPSFTKGFIDLAMKQNPRPTTVAIVAADAEFSLNAADGARENAKKAGLKIVYDRRYPPNTTDYAPIVRAIAATNPDLVVVCSYPPDSVGIVRAVNEINFRPKMIGGAMVGPQNTSIKAQLGPLLNGWVNYDFWLPVPKMNYPGINEMLAQYQKRAPAEGIDPFGYYMAPPAYAQYQVLEQAITATKGLNDAALGEYIRKNTFKTVYGDIRFGKDGEWAESRVLQVQFRGIKNNDPSQFKGIENQVVVDPSDYAAGSVIYPYEKARA
ncbi:MAG: amino acid ABC transporter substrate-binding protein [Xanthobacteraceae bacterium]|nr:amino acid ABC transporter substrate-binding protein [Xanthobacteraceae bacterium]